jgi:hypothetical protein
MRWSARVLAATCLEEVFADAQMNDALHNLRIGNFLDRTGNTTLPGPM